jgi:uncharacterized membrane protein YvbJ
MALISCRECGEKISDKAVACPKCGIEMAKGKVRGSLSTILIVGVIVVALFIAMDAIFSNNKRERAEFERSLDNLNRATRNADKLK